MINNKDKCVTCQHKNTPKLFERDITSTCYMCIFNVEMKKTNNYICEVVTLNTKNAENDDYA